MRKKSEKHHFPLFLPFLSSFFYSLSFRPTYRLSVMGVMAVPEQALGICTWSRAQTVGAVSTVRVGWVVLPCGMCQPIMMRGMWAS